MPPLQTPVEESLEEGLPRRLRFTLGLPEADELSSAKDRDPIGGKDFAVMILTLVADFEGDGIKDEILILIDQGPAVVVGSLDVQPSANPGNLGGRDLGFKELIQALPHPPCRDPGQEDLL